MINVYYDRLDNVTGTTVEWTKHKKQFNTMHEAEQFVKRISHNVIARNIVIDRYERHP